MAGGPIDGGTYSSAMGFIYVFNLIVGFGSLTLPYLVNESGYLLGSSFLALLGLVSFITATYIVESMAIGNAVLRLGIIGKSLSAVEAHGDSSNAVEMTPMIGRSDNVGGGRRELETNVTNDQQLPQKRHFSILEKLELGDMAKLFLGKRGYKILVFVTGLYLYGDLAIYATATPTALVAIYPGEADTVKLPLFGSVHTDEIVAYKVWLCIFAMVVVPLSCLNMQKTKALQLFTCTYRNMALAAMIGLAITYGDGYDGSGSMNSTGTELIASDNANTTIPRSRITIANFEKLPHLFGAATYSFMCHHSIPSIIFPIENKRNVFDVLVTAYIAVFIAYLLLCLSAIFEYGSVYIPRLYILNFTPERFPFWGSLLEMLPVFICFTNYPLIAITTRNNLIPWFNIAKDVLLSGRCVASDDTISESDHTIRLWHSLLVAVPPIIIAYLLQDLGLIVEVTGSYAGLALEFLFPCWLVWSARRVLAAHDIDLHLNEFVSPFKSRLWIFFVVTWSLLSLAFIILTQIKSHL